MKARSLLAILLGFVVGLVGIVGYLSYLLSQRTDQPISPENARVLAIENRAFNQRSNLQVIRVPKIATLDWKSIESTNYVTYIDNLRKIGCPDETIHDIVLADIEKAYSDRRTELYGTDRAEKYWLPEGETSAVLSERRKQLEALEREKLTLIRELLGEDAAQSRNAPVYVGLGFLPEETRKI
jgi:hypothetical protein